MSDNKKYYYLKLKENFFDSEEMIILQNMPDGYLYSDILMKLYLRSLKNEGKLMFKDLIPYTPSALAQVVRHQVGTVEKALKIFQELDLVEILDNGAIYMLDIQNFIGESSTEADRIRKYRTKIKEDVQMLQQMNNKSTPEIEIEIDNNSPSSDGQESSLAEDFEKIWIIYPRKEGKAKAFKSYKVWVKGKKVCGKNIKLTNKQIWYATKKYAEESKEKEKTFIKMGSTFFADAILDYVEEENEQVSGNKANAE